MGSEVQSMAPGHAPIGSSRTLVLIGLALAAILDIVYWLLWFTARDVVASDTTQAYYEFEQAFPVADLWLFICIVGAVVALLRNSHWALFWLIAGGAAGVYLGCMDVLYDIEHGIWGMGGGGIFELFIVVVTFGLSISLMRWSWRRRYTLLADR